MKESDMQKLLVDWTMLVRQKYPELALIFHIPNERKCSIPEAMHLQRMGVKAGVPDLFLPVARNGFHGLWMELKTERGKVSDAQRWWLDHLAEQGYKAVVIRSVNEGINELEEYLK